MLREQIGENNTQQGQANGDKHAINQIPKERKALGLKLGRGLPIFHLGQEVVVARERDMGGGAELLVGGDDKVGDGREESGGHGEERGVVVVVMLLLLLREKGKDPIADRLLLVPPLLLLVLPCSLLFSRERGRRLLCAGERGEGV